VITHTRSRGRRFARALILAWLASLVVVGGASLVEASTATGAGSAPGTAAPAAPGTTPAVQYTLRLSARPNVLSGSRAPLTGSIAPAQKGRTVLVQAKGPRGGWSAVARAHTGARGRFTASWRPRGLGQYQVRAQLLGTPARRKAHGGVTVYRTSFVSWYGPGFYGHRTACGGTLTAGTQGVANKTLPCGTRVTLHYRSSTVTVPVIDRGPYVSGREYDLTGATKSRLHFGSTGTLWSAPHRH
jgi:rare lipoprotein A